MLDADLSLDDGVLIHVREDNGQELEASAVSIYQFAVQSIAELVPDFFATGPIVRDIVLSSLLLNDSLGGGQNELLLITDVVQLIELGEGLPDQLVLEREAHLDGDTRARIDRPLLAPWQIGKVHVDLRAGELDELVEGSYDVPATLIDLGCLNVLREGIILQSILNGLDCAGAPSDTYYAEYDSHEGATATKDGFWVIREDVHFL